MTVTLCNGPDAGWFGAVFGGESMGLLSGKASALAARLKSVAGFLESPRGHAAMALIPHGAVVEAAVDAVDKVVESAFSATPVPVVEGRQQPAGVVAGTQPAPAPHPAQVAAAATPGVASPAFEGPARLSPLKPGTETDDGWRAHVSSQQSQLLNRVAVLEKGLLAHGSVPPVVTTSKEAVDSVIALYDSVRADILKRHTDELTATEKRLQTLENGYSSLEARFGKQLVAVETLQRDVASLKQAGEVAIVTADNLKRRVETLHTKVNVVSGGPIANHPTPAPEDAVQTSNPEPVAPRTPTVAAQADGDGA